MDQLTEDQYKAKYLKYKAKYNNELQRQMGGADFPKVRIPNAMKRKVKELTTMSNKFGITPAFDNCKKLVAKSVDNDKLDDLRQAVDNRLGTLGTEQANVKLVTDVLNKKELKLGLKDQFKALSGALNALKDKMKTEAERERGTENGSDSGSENGRVNGTEAIAEAKMGAETEL